MERMSYWNSDRGNKSACWLERKGHVCRSTRAKQQATAEMKAVQLSLSSQRPNPIPNFIRSHGGRRADFFFPFPECSIHMSSATNSHNYLYETSPISVTGPVFLTACRRRNVSHPRTTAIAHLTSSPLSLSRTKHTTTFIR